MFRHIDYDMRRTALLAVVLLFSINCHAQFRVATYKDGKKAALSFTFDDGASDQLTLAIPQLEERGWRGTFYIIGSFIPEGDGNGFTWNVIRDLAGRGHEIGSHTMTHRNLLEIPYEEAVKEVYDCDSLILARTGIRPLSFAFPFNAADARIKSMAESGKVGSRTTQAVLGGRTTVDGFTKRLDETIDRDGWLVTMTHGIEKGYDHFASLETFIGYLDLIRDREDDLWIAPFAEVTSYIKERDDVRLDVRIKGRKVRIVPECSLDREIFRSTLSLETPLPVRKARQGRKDLKVMRFGGKTLVEFNPFAGNIVLKLSQRADQ